MIGLALLAAGIFILYISGNWLVSGSTSLARYFKIQPFIIAMTLVAFGTSAPELAISINAALKGYEGITIGNIVGSNIANILFAMPIAFLLKIPKVSDVKNIDNIFLCIVTIFYCYILLSGNAFSLNLGIIMLIILIVYLLFITYEAKIGKRKFEIDKDTLVISLPKSILYSAIGILGIILGAEILVEGAVGLAEFFKVSPTIIGLTLVAIGTSIPELAASLVAAHRGHLGFILGAILGSNLFNLLGITGIASIITPLETDNILENVDIYYLFFSMLIFIFITIFLKYLNKIMVSLMLISYLIYVLFLYIRI